MKRAFFVAAASFALTVVAAHAAPPVATGWISDAMCGAKHAGSGADCVKKCIAGGEKPVFVDDKKQVWSIDNPDAVKNYYGANVAVWGSEDASSKSVHVERVAPVK